MNGLTRYRCTDWEGAVDRWNGKSRVEMGEIERKRKGATTSTWQTATTLRSPDGPFEIRRGRSKT